ncbi:MAG: hypothetical protein AVDCRST_MAG31-2171, partial [uncultured Sphingomonas sp.]
DRPTDGCDADHAGGAEDHERPAVHGPWSPEVPGVSRGRARRRRSGLRQSRCLCWSDRIGDGPADRAGTVHPARRVPGVR